MFFRSDMVSSLSILLEYLGLMYLFLLLFILCLRKEKEKIEIIEILQ